MPFGENTPSQSMLLMRIFARLSPLQRNDLLAAAETLVATDRVWADTTPTEVGAYETKFTGFDADH